MNFVWWRSVRGLCSSAVNQLTIYIQGIIFKWACAVKSKIQLSGFKDLIGLFNDS